jgi:hypothetical protein
MTTTPASATPSASLPPPELPGATAAAARPAPTVSTPVRLLAPRTTSTTPASAAKATTTAKAKTTAKKSTTSVGYAKPKATGKEFAFLNDPTLTVEEKLFRFLKAYATQSDQALLAKMDQIRAMQQSAASKASSGTSGTSGSSGSQSSGGFSLWGVVKAVVPGLGIASALGGDAIVKSLVQQATGPILGAAATALGAPMLAPLALKLGPELAKLVTSDSPIGGGPAKAVSSGSSSAASTSTASSSTSATGSTPESEQLEMMDLQRMIDKQREMFSLISNVLRSTHDTKMTIIGNTR